MTDENEQAKTIARVTRRLSEPVRPLTLEERAAGKSHGAAEIAYADEAMIPIPLRRHRERAYVVTCGCVFCETRRTTYLRS